MTCPRCDHEWQPKMENPKRCPKCRLTHRPGLKLVWRQTKFDLS